MPLRSEMLTYSAVILTCVTTMTVLVFALDVLFAKEFLRILGP